MAKRVQPSDELLEWVEDRVMYILRSYDGQAFWTHIMRQMEWTRTVCSEWTLLTSYGRGKVLGMVVDRLERQGIVHRKKNFYPYILTNPLDRIVKALNE